VVSERASLAGLAIEFAGEQAADKAAVRGAGLGLNLKKLRITGAGIGIYSPGDVNAGRIYVRQVQIVDSRIGMWVDYGLDVSRFQDIRVERSAIADGTYGVIFGQNDYMLASQISVAGVDVGVEFRNSSHDGGVGSIASFTGYQASDCNVGLSVVGSAQIASSGLSVAAHKAAVSVGGTANLAVAGSRISSDGGSAVAFGEDASLTISGSTIHSNPNGGDHGFYVSGGRNLNVTGTSIVSNGYGVYFAASPKRGSVAGNAFELTNPSGVAVAGSYANVAVGGNGTNQ
jgi:hypothetical protein